MTAKFFMKFALAIGLLAALFFAEQYIESRGYDRAQAEYQAALNAQKAQAAQTLAAQTERVRKVEQAAQTAVNQKNLKDLENAKKLDALRIALRTTAGPAERLRDPHAAPPRCGGGGSSPAGQDPPAAHSGASNPAHAAGLLSEELTELLRGLTSDADGINAAYASCRTWAQTIAQPGD